MHNFNLVAISTKFNPTLSHNLKIRYHQANKEQRFKFTEIQREKAKHAEQAINLDDFTAKVFYLLSYEIYDLPDYQQIQNQLSKGRRQNDSQYVRLSSADLKG